LPMGSWSFMPPSSASPLRHHGIRGINPKAQRHQNDAQPKRSPGGGLRSFTMFPGRLPPPWPQPPSATPPAGWDRRFTRA
jgi:hypothetical protein